jgi:hypothetical protein
MTINPHQAAVRSCGMVRRSPSPRNGCLSGEEKANDRIEHCDEGGGDAAFQNPHQPVSTANEIVGVSHEPSVGKTGLFKSTATAGVYRL